MKRFFESFLFMSRWLLAPFFVMLAVGLLELLYKASVRLYEATAHLLTAAESDMTLLVLDLIDMTLTGALVVTVMLSVYENFVSRVDTKNQPGWPDWMGSIDFSELKLKLLSTIVAISAIKLLEAFMDVPHTNDRELYFYLGIHMVFVVSTLAFALSERLANGHGKSHDVNGH
ncbi:TIGR00645 family protein [Methylosinus sp. LW4]|uniref:TIGR00645 family protein n=1 Tax=Methylosinus sp. LW4 TaxID=136993 RepID=UPI00037C57EE|nr:TIGR00645 family protein [Methylosinus sp. LW4]